MVLEPLTFAFIGVFLGVLCRTALPYIRKLRDAKKNGGTLGFDVNYLCTAIFALFISAIVSMLVFPSFVAIPESVGNPLAFILAFQFGWGSNDQINELIS